MWIRMILFLLTYSGFALASSAQAVHKLKFVNAPKVVVIQQDGQVQSGQSVRLGDSNDAETVPFHTGRLLPVSYNETPGIQAQQTFKIASNAPFQIEAKWLGGGSATSLVTVSIVGIGRAADPRLRAAPKRALTLGDLQAGRIIFQVPSKTAARPGPPNDQAVTIAIETDTETAARFIYTVSAL